MDGRGKFVASPVGSFLQRDLASRDSPLRAGVAESFASGADPEAALDKRVVRTFIVEDSPIILDNLVATLEEMAPVEVVGSAPDEATALNRLAKMGYDVDLVIIDVFLKSGSGLGVLRGTAGTALKAKRVVLTNYATPDMRDKCRSLGANRVFDKSNDLDELIAYCTRLATDADDEPAPGALSS